MNMILLTDLQNAFPIEPRPALPDLPEHSTRLDLLWTANWSELTAPMLEAAWPVFIDLPAAAFRYYLPAYLNWLLNADNAPHPKATELLDALTLPTDLARSFYLPASPEEPLPDSEELTEKLRVLLGHTNVLINRFLQWTRLLTTAQAQIIHRLLGHVQDNWSADTASCQAKIALYRYWFKFA